MDFLISRLRNAIVVKALMESPPLFGRLLERLSRNVFVCVELIGRVLAQRLPISGILSEKVIQDVLELWDKCSNVSSFQAAGLPVSVFQSARNILFMFVIEIAKTEFFRSPQFVKRFLGMIVESQVKLICKQVWCFLLDRIQADASFDGYLPELIRAKPELLVDIAAGIHDSMVTDSATVPRFSKIVGEVAKTFKASPSRDLLLVLIDLLNFSTQNVDLVFISDFIRKNALEDEGVQYRLEFLLSGEYVTLSSADVTSFRPIKRPELLPFFLSCRNPIGNDLEFLLHMSEKPLRSVGDCDVKQPRPEGCRLLFQGGLDMILLEYLQKGTPVVHKGLTIDININTAVGDLVVIPLIVNIASECSSREFADALVIGCAQGRPPFLRALDGIMGLKGDSIVKFLRAPETKRLWVDSFLKGQDMTGFSSLWHLLELSVDQIEVIRPVFDTVKSKLTMPIYLQMFDIVENLDEKVKPGWFDNIIFWMQASGMLQMEQILRIWNSILFVNFQPLLLKQDYFTETLFASKHLLMEQNCNRILLVKLLKRLALIQGEEQSTLAILWTSSNSFLTQSCLEILLEVSGKLPPNVEKDLVLLLITIEEPNLVALVLTVLGEMNVKHRWILYARLLSRRPRLPEILQEVLKGFNSYPKLSVFACLLSFLIGSELPKTFTRVPARLESDGVLWFILNSMKTSNFVELAKFVEGDADSFRQIAGLMNLADLCQNSQGFFGFLQTVMNDPKFAESKVTKRVLGYFLSRVYLQMQVPELPLATLDDLRQFCAIEVPDAIEKPLENTEYAQAAILLAQKINEPLILGQLGESKRVLQEFAREKVAVKTLLKGLAGLFGEPLPGKDELARKRAEAEVMVQQKQTYRRRQPAIF
jgi:hypothetical protein